MTYKTNCTLTDELLDQITEQGLDVLPELSGNFAVVRSTSDGW